MGNKDDFDKIDSNKDGYISREEYANASKNAGVEKEKLNWFLRLITLGDRFDIKDFFDRFKKSIVEFIILVLVSLYLLELSSREENLKTDLMG